MATSCQVYRRPFSSVGEIIKLHLLAMNFNTLKTVGRKASSFEVLHSTGNHRLLIPAMLVIGWQSSQSSANVTILLQD